MKRGDARSRLLQDVLLILCSIALAILFAELGVVAKLIHAGGDYFLTDSFLAGVFFTSAFTAPLAVVVFGDLAQSSAVSTVVLAAIGACGSVVGDVMIYSFVKNRLAGDLEKTFIALKKGALRPLFRYRFFHWLTFFIGGLIIASPFPDELGIAMLGFSKAKVKMFIPFTFVLNFLGILLVIAAVRAW